MANKVKISLRSIQILCNFLCTALISDVISDAFAGNPSSVNYAIFVCVIVWIVCLYGMAGTLKESILLPKAILILDSLATIFVFIVGVVLASKLRVHSCRNEAYLLSNRLVNGSHNQSKRCRELQAATAFFWFLFVSLVGSLIIDVVAGGDIVSLRPGRIRRSVLSMSQV